MALHSLPRHSSHASLTARLWADALQGLEPGRAISYGALAELAGVDPQQRWDLVETARALVQRTCGKVFEVLINQGLVCLHEPEKLGYAARRLEQQHRALRKTARVLGTVDLAQLTPLEKHRLLGQLSAVAIAGWATHVRTIREAEGKPLQRHISFNPATCADLFKGV